MPLRFTFHLKVTLQITSTCLILFCFTSGSVFCQQVLDYKYLEINNIKTGLRADGRMFHNDGSESHFQVPSDQGHQNGILAGNLVLGGLDEAENLKVCPGFYQSQWQPGFLDIDTGLPFSDDQLSQNRVWSISKTEIVKHINCIADNDPNYSVPDDIMEWPAYGNEYCTDLFWLDAPFYDNNENERYEPLLGDYPIVGNDRLQTIPDQMLYAVSNDFGSQTFGGVLLCNTQVQTILYGFCSQSRTELNNSIFQRHYIHNRGKNDLQYASAGLWFDSSLGCPENDRIGCDTLANAIYVYNNDPDNDDCNNSEIESETKSSVLVTKFLSDFTFESFEGLAGLKFSSFVAWGASDTITSQSSKVDLSDISTIYPLLRGEWSDNTPITIGENGYQPDSIDHETTKYMYHDHPGGSDPWVSQSDDYQFLMNIDILPKMRPNGNYILECIHTFAQSDSLDHIEIIDKGLADAEAAQSEIWMLNLPHYHRPLTESRVWVAPNPSSRVINVYCGSNLESYWLHSLDGRLIQSGVFPESGQIETNRTQGLYILSLIRSNGRIISLKVFIRD